MADKEIIKKGCCFICGADVFIKKSKKNTAYYACNGETSAKSCGSRIFFGPMPSFAMISQQTAQEDQTNERIQSGRQADIENYIDKAARAETENADAARTAATADQAAGKSKSGFDPASWWKQSN